MDRTNAITRLNTEEIAMEVNNVIKKGLDKLLGDHLYRYELLEKTHDAIMNLPSVRNHLNLQHLPQQSETKVDDVKYSQMIEKLLKRIDELTFEVNQLKQTCKKESSDIRVEDELKVVKLEQKENIRLEIEDVVNEAEDASDASSSEEEEEETVASLEEEVESDDLSKAEEEEEEESVASSSEAEENICSECDCKVILDEDIVVVEGKKYCGACDPSSNKSVCGDEASEEVEVEEEASDSEEVETEKSDSEDESEVEEIEAVANLQDEEEEEYIEIDIDDVTYCTNNEENGFIYEVTEDGDLGDKVGYLKDGEPFFYADEK